MKSKNHRQNKKFSQNINSKNNKNKVKLIEINLLIVELIE
jgi:hypothetical protein